MINKRFWIHCAKGSKFGIQRKSALTEVLLFCANAPDNFIEMELGMERGVSEGYISPFISIHGCRIRKKSAPTELLLFCANAPDNFPQRELGMKREVIGGFYTFPYSFPTMATELGKSQRLRSYVKL